MISKGIYFCRLVLNGYRKNYIIPFHPGVNIIYGDADTGKSSILRLIDYMLGAKTIYLDSEITSSVEYISLELKINEKLYTFRRDIYNNDRDIEVFPCGYEEVSDQFPQKYTPTLTSGDDGKKSISEFILSELDFPSVDIKQAPSKDSSRLSRLSFRDIMKYCYLSQDEVGSKKLLDIGNPVVEVKNREVFKYLFNALDSNVSALDAEISEKSTEKTSLEAKVRAISEFLAQTEFRDFELLNELAADAESGIDTLEKEVEEINKRVVSDSNAYQSLKEELELIGARINLLESGKIDALSKVERFTRLSNDYINDISKLKALYQSSNIIGKDIEESVPCPICENIISVQNLAETFEISDQSKIDDEIKSIKRRVKDLDILICDNRNIVRENEGKIEKLDRERQLARRYIDEELSSTISPYLSERDAVIGKLSELKREKSAIVHELKVTNKLAVISNNIARLNLSIIRLKEQLELLTKSMPSLDEVIKELSAALVVYLEKIHIKNDWGISISNKSFLPVIRDVEYRNINSGGLRTIASIGYVAILLKTLMSENFRHPGFIMVDTVGKYLGKTKDVYSNDTSFQEDEAEDVSDPSKYTHIYEYLLDISQEFESQDQQVQILLVDNDVPMEISSRYKGFVVAHYSSEGVNGLPVGLIDDWDTYMQSTN